MTIKNDTHTDVGNAERFVAEYGDSRCATAPVRNSGSSGPENSRQWDLRPSWLHFSPNARSRICWPAPWKVPDEDKRKASIQHAMRSSSKAKIDAMLHLARAFPDIAVEAQDLDSNPLLFNAANGTFNLATMELQPAHPGDMITRSSPVEYDPSALCPRWDKFLREITDDCQPVIDYLQRAAGYKSLRRSH